MSWDDGKDDGNDLLGFMVEGYRNSGVITVWGS